MRKRTFLIVSSLVVAAMALFGVSRWATHSEARPAADGYNYVSSENAGRLIVHEWGTFTSFSGSNGVKLEFRPLIDDQLPGFVVNRAKQVGAWQFGGKSMYLVQERMETPVTYFYTDHERDVSVKVGFPQGLLTEFYPPVRKMLPAFEHKKAVKVRDSELDWGTIRLIPESKLKTEIADPKVAGAVRERLLQALLPAAGGEHYGFARDTDSAIVHIELPEPPAVAPTKKDDALENIFGGSGSASHSAPSGHFFEKFLFYRGIGNFELPIGVVAKGSSQFQVTNSGPDEIRSLFLVTADGTDQLRVAMAPKLDAHGKLVMENVKTMSMEQLADEVVRALVSEKLYEKEARSMVNTWRNSWFGELGTRLFYVVPARLTDELLPLTISPTPDETVRVLVGRFEIMSPEDEARVTAIVKQSIDDRAVFAKKAEKNEELRAKGYALPKAVRGLGRLAEPALVRVRTLTKDPAVREEAHMLLWQWKSTNNVVE